MVLPTGPACGGENHLPYVEYLEAGGENALQETEETGKKRRKKTTIVKNLRGINARRGEIVQTAIFLRIELRVEKRNAEFQKGEEGAAWLNSSGKKLANILGGGTSREGSSNAVGPQKLCREVFHQEAPQKPTHPPPPNQTKTLGGGGKGKTA